MAEMDIVPYIGTRTPADFDTLFDELETARGTSASLSDAIGEKADAASTLAGYGITDAYTKTETDTALESKQNELSQSQLAAANSGITAEKLTADEAVLDWNVNQGVKNLIKLNPNTYTNGNVVVKLNDDGTVSVSLSSGSTANTTFSRPIKTITDLRDMDLILNGCPSGGNYSSGYALYISDDGTSKEKDEGNGVLVPKNTTVTTSYLALIVRSGTAISGTLTFKPMFRPASITDPTFQPYALSNPILTPAAIKAVDEGAKNLFDYDVLGPNTTNIGTSVVVNGVRFTMNSDKSVTITRESTFSQDAYVWFRKSDGSAGLVTDFCDDVHIFSGAAGASASTYRLFINNINGSGTYKYFGEGEIIGVPQATPNAAGISIAAGYSPSNLVIKPMICTKAAWDVSHQFEPYALPNPVLTPAVIKVVDEGAKNRLTINSGSSTRWINIPVSVESGKYRVYFGKLTSDDTDATTCQACFLDSNSTQVSDWLSFNRGSNVSDDATLTSTATTLRLYSSNSYAHSEGDTVTFTNGMVCTETDWNVSQKYVPYCPTMQEMYQMIQALQNGTRSAPALAKAEPEETKPETGEGEEMR